MLLAAGPSAAQAHNAALNGKIPTIGVTGMMLAPSSEIPLLPPTPIVSAGALLGPAAIVPNANVSATPDAMPVLSPSAQAVAPMARGEAAESGAHTEGTRRALAALTDAVAATNEWTGRAPETTPADAAVALARFKYDDFNAFTLRIPWVPKELKEAVESGEKEKMFNRVFADFQPKKNQSMVLRNDYEDYVGTFRDKEMPGEKSYDARVAQYAHFSSLSGEPGALLVGNKITSNLEVVVGRVSPQSQAISYTLTRGVEPESGNGDIFAMLSELSTRDDVTTWTGQGVTSLDVETMEGKTVTVPINDVVMYTGSLYERRPLFNRVFKDFQPKEIQLSGESGFLNKGLKDEGVMNNAMVEYHRFKAFQDNPIALLVKNPDGSMKTVVGAQMPVLKTLTRKYDDGEGWFFTHYSYETKEIFTALLVTTPGGTPVRVPIESVVAYTQSPLDTTSN